MSKRIHSVDTGRFSEDARAYRQSSSPEAAERLIRMALAGMQPRGNQMAPTPTAGPRVPEAVETASLVQESPTAVTSQQMAVHTAPVIDIFTGNQLES